MFYWGVPNTGYLGERNRANEAYYLQADQMLYREPSPATGGKDSKSNPQGLTTYNVFTYSPPANSPVPYYFQTGFSYQGLIPGRDADKIALGFAYGQYSYDKIKPRRLAGQTIQRTEEAVAELSYRVQVSKFAFFQPYVQYIIKPNGDGVAPNATVLGAFMGLDF